MEPWTSSWQPADQQAPSESREPTALAWAAAGLVAADVEPGAELGEVAAEAQVGVPRDEHLVVDRAVRVVAGGAAFLADRAVLIGVRTRLLGVAAEAGFGRGRQGGAAAADGVVLVRVMAVAAAHLAGEHRVAVRQAELAALVEVALEAGFGTTSAG